MMELWNDFEGKTVGGRFQLDHLIGPKGRSAYFTTKDEAGGPAMIRLIESLNDEEEILGRWRAVTGLKEEHLVGVLACGQTVLDGTHLVYAVMEPTDMELADVLRERTLTTEETRQIALSVAEGLQALHAKGLVHEHVRADNVLARGETVKLRSDVVREVPEGADGAVLRSRDVHDLSVLLLECMTRSRTLNGNGNGGRLPAPFEEVVRKGESGAWGLPEIQAALRPMGAAPRVTQPVSAVSSPATTGTGVRGDSASGVVQTGGAPASGAGRPASSTSLTAAAAAVAGAAGATVTSVATESTAPAAVASRLANQGAGAGDGVGAHLRTPRAPDRIVMEPQDESKRKGLLAAIVVGLVVLVLIGLHFFRAARSGQTGSVVQDAPQAVTVPQQSSENRPPLRDPASAPVPQRVTQKPSAALGATAHGVNSRAGKVVTGGAAGSAAQWRVVAFTYNREEQAAQKAQAIGAKHPEWKPEVFSPSGRAPYLVTLGGWMSADQASALRSRARAGGMPHDAYAQNYHGGR